MVSNRGSIYASEVQFLTARMLAERQHRNPRCYGISSDALALYGLSAGPRPQTPGWSNGYGRSWSGDECGTDYPHDKSDLLACELTYEMAPPHVQMRMLPVLEEFRRWVNDGLNRYGAAFPYVQESVPA